MTRTIASLLSLAAIGSGALIGAIASSDDAVPAVVERVESVMEPVLEMVTAGPSAADTPKERAVAIDAAIPDVEMALVGAGEYTPLFEASSGPTEVQVGAFYLDVRPVSNADFLAFVSANPDWRRSQVKVLFAEDGYLKNWAGDLDLGAEPSDSPVVYVSWFAARAYATWVGKRLPSTDEWEYVASASATHADGRRDEDYRRTILEWVSKARPNPLPAAGAGAPNYWGVRDLHGLVWEWTGDFTSALVTADSRQSRDANTRRFCAAGAVGASDFEDYAAFLRYGFRGGLDARFAVPNLGFRLAHDVS
jgi:formylglycine-generating enzyme required for sulfatase activity